LKGNWSQRIEWVSEFSPEAHKQPFLWIENVVKIAIDATKWSTFEALYSKSMLTRTTVLTFRASFTAQDFAHAHKLIWDLKN